MSEELVTSSSAQRPERWSWENKINAASLYMQLGNMRLVSEKTEVPYDTLCAWKKSDWWSEILDEVRQMKKAKTNKRLDAILEVGIDVIADRLANGDWVLNNKTGKLTRKAVSLRDASQVTNALLVRQQQMEELAAKMEHKTDSMADILERLGKEFQKWNRIQQKKQAETIEFKEVE